MGKGQVELFSELTEGLRTDQASSSQRGETLQYTTLQYAELSCLRSGTKLFLVYQKSALDPPTQA